MTFILILQALFYGIIEGITEWIPVSSTGHLILFESFWPLEVSANFLEVFRVVIQLGAVAAVTYKFFKRLWPFSSKISQKRRDGIWHNWINICVACIPVVFAGVFLDDFFDEHFYNWQSVAIALVVYGVALVLIEKFKKNKDASYRTMEEIPIGTALFIGLFQCLALVPGTSRSGVTIVAALLLGCSRVVAADFTFCLSIPVMLGASVLKIFKLGFSFSKIEYLVLIIGMVTAFVVSLVVLNLLLAYIKKYKYTVFGYYRIGLGVIIVIVALIFPSLLPGGAKAESKYGLPDYVEEEYLTVNEYSRPATPLVQVNDIVIHYTANPGTSAENNRSYFEGLKDGANGTYGSSNFIIGIDGEIIATVPITEVAYCSNNRNSDTISIECCHPDETGKFTDETYESLVKLTTWLLDHYNLSSDNIIRHYDVTGKLCPLYFVENEEAWEQFKEDCAVLLEEMHQDEIEAEVEPEEEEVETEPYTSEEAVAAEG